MLNYRATDALMDIIMNHMAGKEMMAGQIKTNKEISNCLNNKKK